MGKTYDDFKDEVAQENGYDDFYWVSKNLPNDEIINICNHAAEQYALHIWKIACERQKEICADEALTTGTQEYMGSLIGYQWVKSIDKNSILYASDAIRD